ncbi:MAG TPA: carbon storage regulator CsrA [Solirubrobacterales bacterium]|nr:carbon storage regulator CsrA [Solirubrobacterales bacterium]
MLTITRRPGEKIMIGDDVVVEIVDVTGTTVRVGITAPRERKIYREELWERVRRENEEAARADPERLGELKPPAG